METTITFRVQHKSVSLIIKLSTICKIFLHTLSKVILIHEIISCIVGWINKNHIDFTKIGFLQELQHFEVVALGIEVFGGIKVHAFLPARTQRFGNGCIRQQNGFLLVRPSELVAFLFAIHHSARNFLHQHILINGTNNLAIFVNRFRYGIGE